MSTKSRSKQTTTQKAAWDAAKKNPQGSRFVFIGTPSNGFNFPEPKYDAQNRRIE